MRFKDKILFFIVLTGITFPVFRNGTTAMNFLEIDIASSNTAMGGACVSFVNDGSSIYWNPAGLAFLDRSEVLFFNQEWIANISHTYTSVAIPINGTGSLGFALNLVNYGDIEVTTLEFQDGTGEYFTPMELSATFSYARKFVDWFGFGSSIKYIGSDIWHSSASAIAADLGVQIYTDFLSSSLGDHDGMKLGMSISNYGSRIKYDGLDLLQPIDISDDFGNFSNVMGKYETSQWELPLLFRLGISNKFIKTSSQYLLISIDALHPNNDKERINIGAEYSRSISNLFNFYLRAGYKGIHINKIDNSKIQFSSPFGHSYGVGLELPIQVMKLKADYSVRFVGRFGMVSLVTIGMEF